MIVVTTPTGQIGSQVLSRLIATDEELRVIVRDPSRLPVEVRERAEVVVGSHDRSDVLASALAGADSVLWVVPPDPRTPSVADHYLNFTRPMCELVTQQEAVRVVGVTTLGHGWPQDAGNLSAAMAMDDLIGSTDVAYRALAMPFFMENLLGQVPSVRTHGVVTMTNAADRPLRTVATADVAAAAAAALLDRSWKGQEVVPVVGPDVLTPEGMAETMSQVLDRPVRYQQVSDQDFTGRMLGYGLSQAWVQGMVAMTTAQSEGIYETALTSSSNDAGLATTLGAGISFRRWCQEVLLPAAA